jgi:hypothetical protein
VLFWHDNYTYFRWSIGLAQHRPLPKPQQHPVTAGDHDRPVEGVN